MNVAHLLKVTRGLCFFFLVLLSNFALSNEVAIGGYSPVSYFTKNLAEKGSEEFTVTHYGSTYHLTSEDQVALFNKDPDKYRPRYHRCAYSVVLGTPLPLDPTNFKVIGDTLLLFHATDESNGRNLWENSGKTDDELISTADRNFTLIEF